MRQFKFKIYSTKIYKLLILVTFRTAFKSKKFNGLKIKHDNLKKKKC